MAKKIIYIDKDNYDRLVNGETVTIGGVDYTYDYDALYYCPKTGGEGGNIIDISDTGITSELYDKLQQSPGSLLKGIGSAMAMDGDIPICGDNQVFMPTYFDTIPRYYACLQADSGIVYWIGINWDDLTIEESGTISTNEFVNLRNDQTINGIKTFVQGVSFGDNTYIKPNNDLDIMLKAKGGSLWVANNLMPDGTTRNIGSSWYQWHDLWLNGTQNFKGNSYTWQTYNNGSQLITQISGAANGTILTDSYFGSYANGQKNLGSGGNNWKDIYFTGNFWRNGNWVLVPSEAGTLALTKNTINNGDIIAPLYGPKIFYNANYDDALWDATRRYYCIMTVHSITYDGATFPQENGESTIEEDNYWIDSPAEQTYNSIDNPDKFNFLFDGSPDTTAITTSADKYVKVRILPIATKNDNYSAKNSTITFEGYPYGWFYVSTYYGSKVSQIKYATYNKHSSWPTGWWTTDGTPRGDSAGMTWLVNDQGHYSRTEMIFWFIGDGDATGTLRPTSIYWIKNRVTNLDRENSYFSKYCDQTLTRNLTWKINGADKAKIYANGNAYFTGLYPILGDSYDIGTTSVKWNAIYAKYLGNSSAPLVYAYANNFYEGQVALSSKYAGINHTHSLNNHPVYALVNKDTRSENSTPEAYYSSDDTKRSLVSEFKSLGAIDSPFSTGSYCNLFTVNQWSDASGEYANQIVVASAGVAFRNAQNGTTWNSWKQFIMSDNACTINDITNIFGATRS